MMRTGGGDRCPFCGSDDIASEPRRWPLVCVPCGAIGTPSERAGTLNWYDEKTRAAARRAMDAAPDPVEGGG